MAALREDLHSLQVCARHVALALARVLPRGASEGAVGAAAAAGAEMAEVLAGLAGLQVAAA